MDTQPRSYPARLKLFQAVPLVLSAVAIAGVILGGCVRETTVFKDRELIQQPPDEIHNFLGYFNTERKLTSCGNCHVGKQSTWVGTRHAGAWAGLQRSPAAEASCEGCHAISERGNLLDEPGGINVVRHERYYDVQCESCHGSGFNHVQNPDVKEAQPAAPMAVSPTMGCGECHQGLHHPFVEQWAQSAHGLVTAQSSATGATCLPCHEGKTALVIKFGETANYIEKAIPGPLPITCGVCHDPHGSVFDADLRADIRVPSLDNFCVKCHARTGTPPSVRGPHAAQGFLVLGENVGWIPPNFFLDATNTIAGTHGVEANPRLCATCHVSTFTVTDPESGDIVFRSIGHRFEAIPCLDGQGLPTAGPCGIAERDFRACAAAGCHGSEDVARTVFQVVRNRINTLLDDIWEDLNANNVIDPFPTDGGVLAEVVAKFPDSTLILDPRDQNITVAEGALWNAQLAFTSERPHFAAGRVYNINFFAHKTSGDGVHNPFLLEALLTESIKAVRDEYGLGSSSSSVDLSVQATPPPGLQSP